MRAQVYLRLGDRARAQEDMVAYLASPRATAENKALGQRFLASLARTRP